MLQVLSLSPYLKDKCFLNRNNKILMYLHLWLWLLPQLFHKAILLPWFQNEIPLFLSVHEGFHKSFNSLQVAYKVV